jgi:hypothetical protein
MPVALSIENLREIERLLKNAQRVVRAATYSHSGGIEPLYTNDLTVSGTATNIADIRTAIGSAANVTAAAQAVIANITDYIL